MARAHGKGTFFRPLIKTLRSLTSRKSSWVPAKAVETNRWQGEGEGDKEEVKCYGQDEQEKGRELTKRERMRHGERI